jgi:hypothetical protein
VIKPATLAAAVRAVLGKYTPAIVRKPDGTIILI